MQNHEICVLQKKLRKHLILHSFKGLITPANFTDWHLSLYPFATIRPLMYFSKLTFLESLNFFNAHSNLVLDSLARSNRDITHAIFSLIRPGSSWKQENSLSLKEPRDLVDFERIWHPEYQRYCEHIFNNLIRIPLEVLGRLRNKNYQSPTLANRVQILQNNSLQRLTKGYNATVRNAISHGSSSFEFQGIKYINSGTEIELTASGFTEILDELVNTCNAMVIALLLFLCGNQREVARYGLNSLPLGVRYLFIDGITSHLGLKIQSMVESETVKNERQLNINCSISSPARMTHIFESLNVSWNSLKFGGENYGRFGISIDCGKSVSAAAFLDGKKLWEAIEKDLPPESAKGIIEGGLLWYDAPSWKRKMHTFRNIFLLQLQLVKKQIHDEWKKMGVQLFSSRYVVRETINKSAGKIRRLEALIVLTESDILDKELLLNIVRHAIRNLKRKRISSISIGEVSKIKKSPSYVWINLYQHDERIRNLIRSDWREKNLLLQAEWTSRTYRKKPVFIKSPDNIFRGIRVKFNPTISFSIK